MYLINTATLGLERFDDEAHLPAYAILSHTWGNSEVPFEKYRTLRRGTTRRLRDISTRESLGHWKIRMTCTQAVEDGLDYAWVDTCCIDKRSSAELSEAINSMFRWYKKAAICYAYLDDVGDVSQHDDTDEYGIPKTLWNAGLLASSEQQLAESRWFTRGWTLQELIAPSELSFYGRTWIYLGSKHSLRPLLASITGINRNALDNIGLNRFSIAQRMSWAAERSTTRVEDLAYSLLGIFDVNMPLLYGEGEKAFIRLQEEIMRNTADQSLLAWALEPWRVAMSVIRTDGVWHASHPQQFAWPELAFGQFRSRQPSNLTNNGIRLEAPILKFQEHKFSQMLRGYHTMSLDNRGKYLIILNCYSTAEAFPGCRVGIICEKVGTSEFVRCAQYGLFAISYQDYFHAPRKDVFLLKNVDYYPAPFLTTTNALVERHEEYIALHEQSLRDACTALPEDRALFPEPLRSKKDASHLTAPSVDSIGQNNTY